MIKFFAFSFFATVLGQNDYSEGSDFDPSDDESQRPFQNLAIAAVNLTKGLIEGGFNYNRCRFCNGVDYTTCRFSPTENCDNYSNAGIDDQMVCEMRWEKGSLLLILKGNTFDFRNLTVE